VKRSFLRSFAPFLKVFFYKFLRRLSAARRDKAPEATSRWKGQDEAFAAFFLFFFAIATFTQTWKRIRR
jgi:hypothetical protein